LQHLSLGGAYVPEDLADNTPHLAGEVNADHARQETGVHMARALHNYQQARFGSVHADYLKIFRDRLQSALRSEESPPLHVAKVEVELFSEQIQNLRSRMFAETVRAMPHWFDAAEKVGARPEIDALLKQSIEQFCLSIGSEALKIAEGYAGLLRDADVAWRTKYPEKVARFSERSA
jgi:hypothetical protein